MLGDFRPHPKPVPRKPKAKKPIPRYTPLPKSKTRIAAKAVFHEWGANPLKTYRRKYTDAQVMAKAMQRKAERLRDRTRAEIIMSEMLDGLRVLYESEAIFLNGDSFILADFHVKSAKLVIEIDGRSHLLQPKYDIQRDAWMLRRHKTKTLRFKNEDIYKRLAAVKAMIMAALNISAGAPCGVR